MQIYRESRRMKENVRSEKDKMSSFVTIGAETADVGLRKGGDAQACSTHRNELNGFFFVGPTGEFRRQEVGHARCVKTP